MAHSLRFFQEVDSLVVRRCQRGEIEAFRELYLFYGRSVRHLGLSLLGSVEEANDLLQDLFVKLHEKIKDYRFEAPFAAWLYRLAVNLCQDRLRARTRKNRFLTGWHHEAPDAQNADTGLLETERDKAVRAALAQVNPRYRVCLVLKEVEDCSYEEIAAILKVSVGTVRSRLSRGREQLRKLLLHEK